MKYELHPLIDPSSHYYNDGEKELIEEMEENKTVIEMIGFASCNVMKYDRRKEKKGQFDRDMVKLARYERYLEELSKIPSQYAMMVTKYAWNRVGKRWSYKR